MASRSLSIYASFSHREVAQMDAFRSIFVNAAHQVLVDLFCHERNHRRRYLCDTVTSAVYSVIYALILSCSIPFRPETLTASSDIPVTHVIHKVLQRPCALRNPVICQVAHPLSLISVFSLDSSHLSMTHSFSYSSAIFCCVKIHRYSHTVQRMRRYSTVFP